MLAQLLSILLIPLFVLGQALPHSHAGSSMGEQDDHANRPHVHVRGGHSHLKGADHHHDAVEACADDQAGSGSCISSRPNGHDSSAVYLASATIAFGRAPVAQHTDVVDVGVSCLIETSRPIVPKGRVENAPLRRYGSLPIYLSVASLRL